MLLRNWLLNGRAWSRCLHLLLCCIRLGDQALHEHGTGRDVVNQTLGLAYAVLPCLLKLAAAAALYLLVVRRTPGSAAFQAP